MLIIQWTNTKTEEGRSWQQISISRRIDTINPNQLEERNLE
jgi:hypothetical protein